MPVPTLITDLTTSAATNSPAGSESAISNDDYLRAHAAFLAQLRNGSAFTTLSPTVAVRVNGATQGQVGTRAGGGSGITANASFDDMIVDSTAASGLSIISGPASLGGVAFGDSANAAIGRIVYDHATDTLQQWANGSEGMRMSSGRNVSIGRTADGGVKLLVDRLGSGTIPTLTAGTVATFAGCSSAGSAAIVSTLSGNTGLGGIYFADTDADARGRVQYDHNSDTLSLWSVGAQAVAIGASLATFTPEIVASAGVTSNGDMRVGSIGMLGYMGGTGGMVTQATSKSTAVTLNKQCSEITMNSAALASNAVVSFTFNNSYIGFHTGINVTVKSGAAAGGSYHVSVDNQASGSCRISVRNMTGGSLSEAVVLTVMLLSCTTS